MIYTNTAIYNPAGAAPPASQPLIDQVGVNAVAALGFKKLRAAYTGDCIRVRRASDNGTADIGFTAGGDVDTAAIASFCGASQGTIAVWFDQSGNANHFTPLNTPQPGQNSNEPIIYYNSAVTTDAAGNIAAFSIDPGSTSATGLRFLNSPLMPSKNAPTISFFGQVNRFNGNGIMQTELENGYNMGTYGAPGSDGLTIIQSNGQNICTKQNFPPNVQKPFASTIFYNVGGGNSSKWWITTQTNDVAFDDVRIPVGPAIANTFTSSGFNASTFNNVSIFRYYSATLYQNCAMSGWIYWDLTSGTTFTNSEVYDLYAWVETNLGYVNNAPI